MAERIAKLLDRFIFGFLFGLGLFTAVLLAGYLYEYYELDYDEDEDETYTHFDTDSGLTVENVRYRSTGDGHIVLATLVNAGSSTWSYITLEAEFFDAQGEFYDECTTELEHALKPGASEHIKFECSADTDLESSTGLSVKAKVTWASLDE